LEKLLQSFVKNKVSLNLSSFENGRGVDIGLRKVLQIIDYLGYKIELKPNSLFPSFEELRDAE